MINRVTFCLASWLLLYLTAVPLAAQTDDDDIVKTDPKKAKSLEAEFLSNPRQLTFEGRRAGEGYFSRDGSRLIFQSEREPGNPFFQIYLMDLETGDVDRMSPGHGKTTCAWIHPTKSQVLFASTHEDPQARAKQRAELEMRAKGTERRYSWDYDEHYDIYRYDLETKKYTNLTNARGYDAEGSWSPDGKWIAFASNRLAYDRPLTKKEAEMFKIDPAFMMDIYIMRDDGTQLRRLTEAPGYDGGPFFSPDGKRICWRRFAPNGATAEIMTMNVDGSDKRQLTDMGVMSWGTYYHPSGDYLIFTTNRHSFGNFELYLVAADGSSPPVRVTHTNGFDGLPVFTPDGKQLAWTTNRTSSKRSQIFLSPWNDKLARKKLNIGSLFDTSVAEKTGNTAARQTTSDFSPQDALRHVNYLCHPDLGGRLTGTKGEKLATAYVAAYLDSLGLKPAGDDGHWYQEFEFTAGVALGQANELLVNGKPVSLDKDWRPVAFSKTGPVEAGGIVFAGYGIVAPAEDDHPEYDAYVHLDVKDKWVLVFRYLPEDVSPERRQHLSRYSSLRYKAMQARDRGARGLLVVSGPTSGVRRQLVELRYDGSILGASLPVVSVSDELAAGWLKDSDKSLAKLQRELDTGKLMGGFDLKKTQVAAAIDIQRVRKKGRNVLGRLAAGKQPTDQVILVGAHIDHLGQGANGSSLARDDERNGIHFGADDNASGVAAMLEIAEYLADQQRQGRLKLKRDIIFAAWSGEELGLIGSSHFVKTYGDKLARKGLHGHAPKAAPHSSHSDSKTAPKKTATKKTATKKAGDAAKKPHAAKPTAHQNQAHSDHHHQVSLYPAIAACLNMDMVGRMEKKVVLQGIGSSSLWRSEIERRNAPVGLPLTLQSDSYLPTDASSFYIRGVPILSAFTGSHRDYHTPRDTPDKLNYEGLSRIARFMALVTRSLAQRQEAPDYVAQAKPESRDTRGGIKIYLGTIPDYAEGDTKGVPLSGVGKGGPAEKAGLRAGDIIVELAGKKVDNIYDYMFAMRALKIGKKAKIVVLRGNKKVESNIVPRSRD